VQHVHTCLWFDGDALEFAERATSLIPNSKILTVSRYPGNAGANAEKVLTVHFSLDGTEYMGLNGGPHYPHTPAASIVVACETQEEVDRLWDALCDGGQKVECGWVTDRFGVSWQVVPRAFFPMITSDDRAAAQRAMDAMMTMQKLHLPTLEKAFKGE